jgi:hypothetical protein
MKKIYRPALPDVVEDKQECPFATLQTHKKNVRRMPLRLSEALLMLSGLVS